MLPRSTDACSRQSFKLVYVVQQSNPMGKKEKGKASAKGKDAKGKQAPEAAAPSKKERKAQQIKVG